VYVEPDMDYFKDPAAHLLLEVIPNGLTGNVSNPRVVYCAALDCGKTRGRARVRSAVYDRVSGEHFIFG
jgi:hypothetical protein